MQIAVVLLLAISSICVQGPVSQQVPQQVAFTNVDRIGEPNARHFFVFTSSFRNYAIRHDGHSEGTTFAARRNNFELRMGGSARLQRVYFAEYEGDLLIEYEVTSPQGNWGYVLRMDQKTMKYKWVAPVSADNLGPGLIDGRELYFSGSSFLAKMDLQSGGYLWQSEPGKFFTFSVPMIKGDKVIFRDESETERTVEVEKETGRLLKS
jgi:hypothetical protein